MNQLIQKVIKTTILCMGFLLIGCSDKHGSTEMKDIELKNDGLKVTFSMPVAYKAEKVSEALMLFRCKYPHMEALDPNGLPQNEDIDIYISLLKDRPSRPERLVAEASDSFDSKHQGRAYHVGKHGMYELYRYVRGHDQARQEVTIYVFKASDGVLVGVEDPGGWSRNYEAERKLGNNLHIRYLISKDIQEDFAKIDEAVTTFIKSHLETSNKG